jgi:hypothetical protein
MELLAGCVDAPLWRVPRMTSIVFVTALPDRKELLNRVRIVRQKAA